MDGTKVEDRIEANEISIKPRRRPFRQDNGAQTTIGRNLDRGFGIRRAGRGYESRPA